MEALEARLDASLDRQTLRSCLYVDSQNTCGDRWIPASAATACIKCIDLGGTRGDLAGDGGRRIDSFNGGAARARTSTISREIKRNGGGEGYRANQADEAAWERARRPKRCKLIEDRALARIVADKFRLLWSPEQIAGRLKHSYPSDESHHVSHETIYLSLFIQARPRAWDTIRTRTCAMFWSACQRIRPAASKSCYRIAGRLHSRVLDAGHRRQDGIAARLPSDILMTRRSTSPPSAELLAADDTRHSPCAAIKSNAFAPLRASSHSIHPRRERHLRRGRSTTWIVMNY